jgi:hypothetical protein
LNAKFAALVETLHPSFERLKGMEPHTGKVRLPLDVPPRAVYMFSEGDDHLYVGRTNRLRHRHREHWSGKSNDAPFAFKLAREKTGRMVAKGGLTRAELEIEPAFAAAFVEAKDRVAAMAFRWVEETDANRQCLLEIYATIALGARFNDFENH